VAGIAHAAEHLHHLLAGRLAQQQLVHLIVERLHLGKFLRCLAHRVHLQSHLGGLQLQPHVGAARIDLGAAGAARGRVLRHRRAEPDKTHGRQALLLKALEHGIEAGAALCRRLAAVKGTDGRKQARHRAVDADAVAVAADFFGADTGQAQAFHHRAGGQQFHLCRLHAQGPQRGKAL